MKKKEILNALFWTLLFFGVMFFVEGCANIPQKPVPQLMINDYSTRIKPQKIEVLPSKIGRPRSVTIYPSLMNDPRIIVLKNDSPDVVYRIVIDDQKEITLVPHGPPSENVYLEVGEHKIVIRGVRHVPSGPIPLKSRIVTHTVQPRGRATIMILR